MVYRSELDDVRRGVRVPVGVEQPVPVRGQRARRDGRGAARAARRGGAARRAGARGGRAARRARAVRAAGAAGGGAAGPRGQRGVLRAAGHRARGRRRGPPAQGHRHPDQSPKEEDGSDCMPRGGGDRGARGSGDHVTPSARPLPGPHTSQHVT